MFVKVGTEMYWWNVWNVKLCILTSSFVLGRLNYIKNLNEIQVSNLCIWVSFFYCLVFIFTIYDINFTGLDSNDGCNCISLVLIFHWNSWNFHVNLTNRNKKVYNWLLIFRFVIYVWLPTMWNVCRNIYIYIFCKVYVIIFEM